MGTVDAAQPVARALDMHATTMGTALAHQPAWFESALMQVSAARIKAASPGTGTRAARGPGHDDTGR